LKLVSRKRIPATMKDTRSASLVISGSNQRSRVMKMKTPATMVQKVAQNPRVAPFPRRDAKSAYRT